MPQCFNCAIELMRYTGTIWDDEGRVNQLIPELVNGECPVCSGSSPLEAEKLEKSPIG
ncbi:MAG: hypothetical protein WC655_29990 [Candidatus Hydrogenedentales bacterium]